MQSEKWVPIISKNIDLIIAPPLLERGFVQKKRIVEKQVEWHFEKIVNGYLCLIMFRNEYENTFDVDFEVMRPGLGGESTTKLDEFIPDLAFGDSIVLKKFDSEEELKQLLDYFIPIILEQGISRITALAES